MSEKNVYEPIHTFLSFVLTFISVIVFAFSLTILMKGNPIDIMIKNLKENEIKYVYMENLEKYPYFMENKYTGDEFAPLYFNKGLISDEDNELFWARYTVEIPDFDKFNLNFIHGTYPQTYTQLAITDYIAENTVLLHNERFTSIDELIGETFSYGFAGLNENIEVEISGIIETEYKVDGDDVKGDYLYPHYYVKSGFIDYYREKIKYGLGMFILSYNRKELDNFILRVNDQTPKITTVKNPLLFTPDVKVITERGSVDIQKLELAENEVLLNINYYNYLFREENDYLSPENIFEDCPAFNEIIEFKFHDYITDSRIEKSVIVKGIIFDSKNEYNYVSLCVILSDDLFNNIVQYYKMPTKYLIDLSSPNIYDLFYKHHPYAKNIPSSDKIRTELDFNLDVYLSRLNEGFYLTLVISVILTLFSWLLNYRNAKKNVENKISTLEARKKHIIFLFLKESLILFTIILPLSILSINSIFNALNKSYSGNDYILKVLYLNAKNIPIIIFYLNIVIFLPVIIFIVKYIKKTPTEVIEK